MKFAYADPPYIGYAHYYHEKEVDHKVLLEKLHVEYDGWALSTHVPGLWDLLPMIPKDWKCRVAAWCRTYTPYIPGQFPAWSWEAVIFKSQRKTIGVRDWLICPTFDGHKRKTGLIGAKPDEFCFWIFELLGMKPKDEFDDLFSGTGRVKRAWNAWRDCGKEIFQDA